MLRPAICRTRREHGIALPITLIVLTAMVFAGVALARSAYTGNRVAANVAFQEAATRSADVGLEQAISWLQARAGDPALFADLAPGAGTLGYFASRPRDAEPVDGVSWARYWEQHLAGTGRVNTLPADEAGNQVQFVIHRLCDAPGDPAASASACVQGPSSADTDRGSHGGGARPVATARPAYLYRVTVRVAGPRDTLSIVQAVVSL